MPSSPPPPAAPPVPFVDVGAGGGLALLAAAPERAQHLLDLAERRYLGRIPLRIADRNSRRWLARSGNPYLAEIDAVAEAVGRPGAHMLNLSFEWACTAAVGPDPQGVGARLLRTLDWKLEGLGETVMVARHDGPAGPWLSVTWPGFVGALTVLAPGRFAAAINQPPMRMTRIGPLGMPVVIDWLAVRSRVLRSTALPPAHLLRQVCETARDYGEARRMLAAVPVCIPAFYTLCGLAADEGCLIERLERQAFSFEAPVCAANHWLAPGQTGRQRKLSPERQAFLSGRMSTAEGLDWLEPPVLNPTTRVAVLANPATGRLLVQGVEPRGPVTAPTLFAAA